MIERLRSEQAGFSLPEVLMATVLMLLLLGTTLTVLSTFERTTSINQRQNDAQEEARRTTARLARELRNLASPGAVTELPKAVERAQPQDLAFLTVENTGGPSGNNSGNVKRVRYCLTAPSGDKQSLVKQEQRWSGATGDPAPTLPGSSDCPAAVTPGSTNRWHSRAFVNTNVTNGTGRPFFLYRTLSATCDAAPDSSDDCREEINAIDTQLFIDVNPGRRPTESELRTGVFLRNQNRRPTATFEYEPLSAATHEVLFNASASSDPEASRLDFRWFLGPDNTGTPLPETGPVIRHSFTAAEAAGSPVEITVEVTDGAGLVSTFTRDDVVIP